MNYATDLNYATLPKSNELGAHILVFLVCSIINSFKFILTNFATKALLVFINKVLFEL